jgi:hypothetical protein
LELILIRSPIEYHRERETESERAREYACSASEAATLRRGK